MAGQIKDGKTVSNSDIGRLYSFMLTEANANKFVDSFDLLDGLVQPRAQQNAQNVETAMDRAMMETIGSQQRFEADLSKYENEYAKKTIQNLMDSGLADNSDEFHTFADWLAKISADKGIVFNLTDTGRLQGTRHDLEGKFVDGFIDENGNITLNIDSQKAGQIIVGHEITHVLEGTELYKELQSAIKNYAISKMGLDAFNAKLRDIEARYKGLGDPDKEMTADLIGELLFTDADFIKNLSAQHRNVFQRIWDEIKYLCKVVTAGSKEARQLEKVKKLFEDAYRAETKNTAGSGGVRYTAGKNSAANTQLQYDHTKPFADQIADFQTGNFPQRDTLTLGATPTVLKRVGLVGLPMTINQQHVGDALNGTYNGTLQEKLDHTFTPQELATLPKKIADPIAIIHDKRTGKANPSISNIDVLVEMKVASGKDVIVAVQVGGNGQINGLRIDANKVSTVHGNTDTITRLVDAINDESKGDVAVFYLNKGKTTKALQRAGNPIPRRLSNLDGFIHSITDPGSPVKIRISSVTESKQFMDWFGNWKKHPESASKVVNADGTPKVMYHGTSRGGFTVFNTYGSNFGLFGLGSYFTDDPEVALSYTKKGKGDNPAVYEVYLNIKNPIDMDAAADLGQWRKAFMDFDLDTSYLEGASTNEDAFRALKENLADEYYEKHEAEDTVLSVLEHMGYDGITHIGGGRFNKNDTNRHRVYIAFEPNQIKSATDNLGTFDGQNPDIRYSLTQTVGEADNRGLSPLNKYKFLDETSPDNSIRQSEQNSDPVEKLTEGIWGENDTQGQDVDEIGYKAYYEAGLSGAPMESVTNIRGSELTEEQKQEAYERGRREAAESLLRETANAPLTPSFGNKAKLLTNDHSKRLSKQTRDALNELARMTGINIRLVDMEDGFNGNYDEATGTMEINAKVKNAALVVAAHEVTHRMKQAAPQEYRQYRDYVVNAISQKIGRSALEYTMERYARQGIELTTEGAMDELASDFAMDMVRDGKLFQDLMQKHRSAAQVLLDSVKAFLSKVKNLFWHSYAVQNSVTHDHFGVDMETLEHAVQMWETAMTATRQQVEGKEIAAQTDGGEKRFALAGWTKDGRRVYETGFDSSIPEKQRIELFKERIATVFNLGAVNLKTDTKKILINGDKITGRKNVYGDDTRSKKTGEFSAKINALYDMADILTGAKFVPPANVEESYANPNISPKNKAHKGVKYWYKFRTYIVMDGTGYEVTFNIRDKGKEQYQYLIEFKEDGTPAVNNTISKRNLLSSTTDIPNSSIRQTSPKSKKQNSVTETETFRADRAKELMDKYGTIYPGENPHRKANVPRKTSGKEFVSQTIRTVIEAKATPDAYVPRLEELAAEGEFSFERYTDQQAMDDARDTIIHLGYQGALTSWTNAVERGKVSKKNTALGWELYRQAANANDMESAVTILNLMVEHQPAACQWKGGAGKRVDYKETAELGNGVLEENASLSGANTAAIDSVVDFTNSVK